MRKLSLKQEKFVDRILGCMTHADAYRSAYSARGATAQRCAEQGSVESNDTLHRSKTLSSGEGR